MTMVLYRPNDFCTLCEVEKKEKQITLRQVFPWITIYDQVEWAKHTDLKKNTYIFPATQEVLIAVVSELIRRASLLKNAFSYYLGYPQITVITYPRGIKYCYRSYSFSTFGLWRITPILMVGSCTIDLSKRSYSLIFSEQTTSKIKKQMQNFFVGERPCTATYEYVSQADVLIVHDEIDSVFYKGGYEFTHIKNELVLLEN